MILDFESLALLFSLLLSSFEVEVAVVVVLAEVLVEFETTLVLFATLAKFFSLEVADLLFRTDPARIIEFVGMDRVGVEPALRLRSTATGTIHLRLLFSPCPKLPLEGASDCVELVLGKGNADGRMTA